MIEASESTARDAGASVALLAEYRRYEIIAAITRAAYTKPEITSDDVWDALESWGIYALDHPNTLGAAFLQAARAGVLESTGHVKKSARIGAHRRRVMIWRSRIFREARA